MNDFFNTSKPILGYSITQQIYLGNKTIIFRGIREEDQKCVIIKVMRNEYPTLSDITQFCNQYAITKNLDIPGIIKTYSLENYHNRYALIMEDFGGISLSSYMAYFPQQRSEGKLPITKFLDIAIKIASTLAQVHRHYIIHKDIKPTNILIYPNTLEVKLTDFSIASIIPKEVQEPKYPNILEGTLAYISPEQTGRMNRGVDYRSDFYSLGVTFFELITGELPFTSTDPMELVYCHIAKQPPKANDVDHNIPSVISEIISKLMAKNAEDRYQSALGLKHDLEICKQQWQETRNIAPFEIGRQDIPDCFLIPEKLYGRKHEVETLLSAFERVAQGATEMVLVVGTSGIGKTAVVNEVHKPIVRQRSYFIKGKFDQLQRDIPLSGFVQSFQDLIRQILGESDQQIEHWKTKILSALGTQGQIMIDLIPNLELIIGKQPTVVELSGNAAQNRFNSLFQRFIQVFTSEENPLVIFLDDLQWADATSLQLLQLLMGEEQSLQSLEEIKSERKPKGRLLLIGAYRDNEVARAHPLYLILSKIDQVNKISRITLNSLREYHLNEMIADTLRCHKSAAAPLTQMIFVKTKGNPFFTHQFLKYLHSEEIIKFNFDLGYWQCDISKVKALTLTDDDVEFIMIQLQKLPIQTQEVLKLAACIGNKFDLKTLASVYQKLELDTAADLWSALIEGLVLPDAEVYKLFQDGNVSSLIDDSSLISSNEQLLTITNHQIPKYKFVHDKVQQAAYSLIPQSQTQTVHLKIAQRLLSNTPAEKLEENIFEIVNQFNMAQEIIINQTELDELITMNLIAGRKAKASTAYAESIKYLTTGIQLLVDECWETKYELTIALYETAAETAYLAGDFTKMENFIEVILEKAKTTLDTVKAYEIKIQAYTSQNKLLAAILIAREALKQFGVTFPKEPSESDIQRSLQETGALVGDKTIEELINLPVMTSSMHLAIMRILSSMIPVAYIADSSLFPLIILLQINLSVKYGNAPLSAFCYACYGIVLNGIMDDVEAANKFGKLALNLVSTFNSKDITTRTLYVLGAFIFHTKSHIRETFPLLLEGYQTALDIGNLEFVGYNIKDICQSYYFTGQELQSLEQEIKSYCHILDNLKQITTLNYCKICLYSIRKLIGENANGCILTNDFDFKNHLLNLLLEANDLNGLHYFYLHKLITSYLFQDIAEAQENAAEAKYFLHGGTGFISVPVFYFYDSLIALAAYSNVRCDKQNLLNKVKENQIKLQKSAQYAPMNYLHKFYLVEAEQHRVLGQYSEAMEDYDLAITLAKEHEYINEEALANELAAKFYLEWGKEKIGQTYLTDAYYGYIKWGAKAKAKELIKPYTRLLSSILPLEEYNLHNEEKITYSDSTSLSTVSDEQVVIASKTNGSASLDLTSVIKASIALSAEINLDQLLSTLMKVLIENAGASKCALILSEGEELKLSITAVSSSSNSVVICTDFPSLNLQSSKDVPSTLINYVKRTQETLVIDDVIKVASIVSEPYIALKQPKSLLCIPITNQKRLIGILYLENNLTTAAFTSERIEILKLITTQVAICLENAMLYNNLEEKVKHRTQELNEKKESLQKTLWDLQRTQAQLFQAEKMSSLGRMVAGVAHEINNPISFIEGNITHAHQYIEDLFDLIAIYQQEYPHLSGLIKQKFPEVELDLLVKDLQGLLNSIYLGTSRIKNIVLGLRNFSRLDEAEMKSVNIHEGIDSTLMLLQHRLKANRSETAIHVIKEYGNLPLVTCYPGHLNQVFMNILSNAIDALQDNLNFSVLNSDLVSITPNLQTKTQKSPTIHIFTEVTEHHTVKVRIVDNGSGMTNQVQQKIFDPFFTTKPVGLGTGLGLSISYQIIVDKHKGKLTCKSALGKGSEFLIELPIQM